MKFNYDIVADAVYLALNKGKVQRTIDMRNGVILDVGSRGKIIGIEILNFSHQQKNKAAMKKLAKYGVPLKISEGAFVAV